MVRVRVSNWLATGSAVPQIILQIVNLIARLLFTSTFPLSTQLSMSSRAPRKMALLHRNKLSLHCNILSHLRY